ncbi:MAG TPA: hypothetical protein VNH65_11585 [Candidatus Acidoferrum sp.]|nr:hypothetical protein [Candidatus Acidoferrum sp.]
MTSVRAHLPAYRWFHAFRNASVRTGVYAGIFLSAAFSAWVIVANRVHFLDRFALVRNLAAVAVLGLLALIPVLRFWRMPGNLLASSLVGWFLFSLTYRILCMNFEGLAERYSAVQVFMLGAVLYMLVVTVSWIGTIIQRARASNVSHPNHHPS